MPSPLIFLTNQYYNKHNYKFHHPAQLNFELQAPRYGLKQVEIVCRPRHEPDGEGRLFFLNSIRIALVCRKISEGKLENQNLSMLTNSLSKSLYENWRAAEPPHFVLTAQLSDHKRRRLWLR